MNVNLRKIIEWLLLGCGLLITFSCQGGKEVIDGLPCRLSADGKWGIVSTDGQMIVPYVLNQKPSCVVNGMFVLQTEDGFVQLYQVKNPLQPVTSRKFYRIGYFFEEVTIAQENPQAPVLLIDKSGRTVFSTEQVQQDSIDLVYNFSEGRALFVNREGKYGYFDTKGNVIIPPLYDCAHSFREGIALVGVADSKGRMAYQLIDRNGLVLSYIQVRNGVLNEQVEEGLLFCKSSEGYCYYLNMRGELAFYLPEGVDGCTSFLNGMAVFQSKGRLGVVDNMGKILIPANYDGACVVDKNRIVLCLDGRYALANSDGKLLSPMQYASIGRFYQSGMSVVRKDSACFFMNRKGDVGSLTWECIVEDAEACWDVPQFFFRQTVLEKDSLKNDTGLEKRVENPKKHLGKREMDRNGWKKIAVQSPFYEEMKQVISGELEETDAVNRQLILNYVEHLRTSYTTKDIDFLEQLFSENALIIVGSVIKSVPQKDFQYLPEDQVVYNVRSKREYLTRLREVFKKNQRIEVGFDDFKIMRHPTRENIYGVTLRQHYSSDKYTDDGYLFLLWDFQDRMAPEIHVRTWQPFLQDDQTPLPLNRVFNIRNFNLE